MAVDPSRDSVNQEQPQSWNRYSYVKNNPILRNDPSGRVDNATIKQDAKDAGVKWTPSADPNAKAFEHALGFGLVGLMLAPVVAVIAPEAAGAIGTGALVGGATALAEDRHSNVSPSQRVDAVATAMAVGSIEGPVSGTTPLGILSGMGGSLLTSAARNNSVSLTDAQNACVAGMTGTFAALGAQGFPKPAQPFVAGALQYVFDSLTAGALDRIPVMP